MVLAVGVQPNRDAERLFDVEELATDQWQWVDEPEEDVNPGQTSIPGVYVAGAASGAKDIADSILHAGAAVAQVAAHLERTQAAAADRAGAGMSEHETPTVPAPRPTRAAGRRIGVYVCHCGGNISDYVDVDKVIDDIRHNGDVVVAKTGDVHLLRRHAVRDRRRHPGERPRRPRRRVLLAQAPHLHVPRRRPAGRPEPLRVHPGQHPRAVLVGPHGRPRRRHGEGHGPGRGGHRADPQHRPARAAGRRDASRTPSSSAGGSRGCGRPSAWPTSACA